LSELWGAPELAAFYSSRAAIATKMLAVVAIFVAILRAEIGYR
jgi:hypothetical protein